MPACRRVLRISMSSLGCSLSKPTTTHEPMAANSRFRSFSRISLTRLGIATPSLDVQDHARAQGGGNRDLADERALGLRRAQAAQVVEERGQVGGQVLGLERLLADRR